jgi:branched-chain amino acid transport system permease protein
LAGSATVTFALQLIFAGVCIGATYALIAIGLTLTFWTTRTMNFGQGSLLMVAAVTATTLMSARLPAYLAVPVALLLSTVLMILVERIAIRPLSRTGESMGWIVATLGFGLLLQGIVARFLGSQAIMFPSLVFGPLDFVKMAGVRVSAQYLTVLVLSVGLVCVMEAFIHSTRWGRAVRAVAHDSEAAAVAGVPVRGVVVASFAVSGALAGLAGILISQITGTVEPQFGFNLVILGFVAAVFGGMGSISGALIGGIVLGVAEELAGGFISTAFGDAMAFAVLMAILAVRPQGLFGRRDIVKV